MAKLAMSVDLEPNADGSLDGIADAMDWYDELVDRSTIYTTYRIATELPGLVSELAESHEIGVHVHPVEFGFDHDGFANLRRDDKSRTVSETRDALLSVAGVDAVRSFRAGRHSVDDETLDVLQRNGFDVDASINVNYGGVERLMTQRQPCTVTTNFVEIPVSYYEPRWLSKQGLDKVLRRNRYVTATASTLRTDTFVSTGVELLEPLFHDPDLDTISMYLHPYDVSGHSARGGIGNACRNRFEKVFGWTDEFVTASDVYDEVVDHGS